MPQKVKKRGGVKGETLTVIGLPKKGKGPLPFVKLALREKQVLF